MDESLRAQLDLYLPRLDVLIRRGHQLRDTLAADPSSKSGLTAHRVWQQDVGGAINELSGGSKAHWLARAFSEAFLLRSSSGTVVQGAEPAEIVSRLVNVLKQAVASLAQFGDGSAAVPSTAAPVPRRFDFVHNAELRPVLERAYADGRLALEQTHYRVALFTACGILEAIVTDALEHNGVSALDDSDRPVGKVTDWSFETRLAVAEKAGLIRRGCARLPLVARTYRNGDINEAASKSREDVAVSEHDARVAGQVLRVVMRDLDPGR